MTKLLALTAAVLLVASSAAYAGCSGVSHSIKSASTAPTQTLTPVPVQTATAETK